MVGRCILGPKTISQPNVYQTDITFTSADFNVATGYATLDGPLSLTIDVNNNLTTALYFGLDIYYDIGFVTVADRTHIGFVASGEHKTIGPASVPQLAILNHTITKIVLHVYCLSINVSNASAQIALIVDAPAEITASQIYIGRDTEVFSPNIPLNFSTSAVAITPGSNATSFISLTTVPVGLRYIIKWLQIYIPPTPSWPGDIRMILNWCDRGSAVRKRLREYRSRDNMPVSINDPLDFILDAGMSFELVGGNENTGVTYSPYANLNVEVIF